MSKVTIHCPSCGVQTHVTIKSPVEERKSRLIIELVSLTVQMLGFDPTPSETEDRAKKLLLSISKVVKSVSELPHSEFTDHDLATLENVVWNYLERTNHLAGGTESGT